MSALAAGEVRPVPAADDDLDAWLALSALPHVGETTFWSLIATYGAAARALHALASGDFDAGRLGIPRPAAPEVAAAAAGPLRLGPRLEELGVWVLRPVDPDWPDRLSDLDPKPAVLFGRGSREVLGAARCVAIVGTRRPTYHGRGLASQIATRMAEAGGVVVSGLAFGIDGAAHAAAVTAGGRSVAVIGGGHAHPGPRAHSGLLRSLLDGGGAVLSELPPDTTPTRGTFPRRNRIISALGDATIVVEAPARSGALITARRALELGRPVFAAPGRPFDRTVAGCLALLRETPARPIVGLDELIVDLGWDLDEGFADRPATRPEARLSTAAALALLAPAERAVAARVARGPAGADTLVADTGLAPAVVSGALILLQLRGWVQVVGPAYLPCGPLLRTDHR